MPRLAVGVRPSASSYAPAVRRAGCGEPAFAIPDVRRRVGRSDFRAPAVPRGLRLCRAGCGGLAFYIRAVCRRVGRSDFRAPAVPRGLRRARLLYSRRAPQGGPIGLSRSRRAARFAVVSRGLRRARLLHSRCAPQGGPIGLSRSHRAARFAVVPRGLRGVRLLHSRRAPQGRSFFIHYVKFFPDVHIDSFTPHRPPARGHGGGAVFSRRERTVAHGHARTARFGGASGHSRGRISAPARRGFATLCPLAPPMVGGLGGATAAPDAGAGTRGDFDPPRQPTC